MTELAPAWLLLSVAGIACLSGTTQSLVGFGYGITSLAIFPFVLEMRQSHLVASLSGIPPLILSVCLYSRHAVDATFWWGIVAGIASMPLGLLAFSVVSVEWLTRMTALAILVVAVGELRAFGRESPIPHPGSNCSCIIAGCLSGFLAGAVSMSGPPIAAFALRQNWPASRYRAFVSLFLLALAVVKGVGLGCGGFLDANVVSLSPPSEKGTDQRHGDWSLPQRPSSGTARHIRILLRLNSVLKSGDRRPCTTQLSAVFTDRWEPASFFQGRARTPAFVWPAQLGNCPTIGPENSEVSAACPEQAIAALISGRILP